MGEVLAGVLVLCLQGGELLDGVLVLDLQGRQGGDLIAVGLVQGLQGRQGSELLAGVLSQGRQVDELLHDVLGHGLILLFLDSAKVGLLKNVHNQFSRCFGSREMSKTKVGTFF